LRPLQYKAQMLVMDGLKAQRGAEPDPYKDLLDAKKALHEEIGAKMAEQRDLYKLFKVRPFFPLFFLPIKTT
jgi:hypothetical protein